MTSKQPTTFKKTITIILLIGFIGIIIWAFQREKRYDEKLQKDGLTTDAILTAKKRTYRRKMYIHYEYNVNNKIYKSSGNYYKLKVEIGDTFKIIYDPQDPEIHRILLYEKDYKLFKLNPPIDINK
jgi:hypothetical protein